ncbi:MAG: surface carbohydrate biosynthesis protein [Myxococcota bacterium]
MRGPASTLIIPVESQVRELDAKLLLACVAAERGFRVVLGSRAYVHHRVHAMGRGVYLAKSLRPLSDRMFGILRQLGHHIVAFDEEGLVRFSDDVYYRRRLSPSALRRISILLAWGPDSARLFRDAPSYSGIPIRITGNPRIDLMRPELREFYRHDVDDIHRRFGDLILVNTNFAMVNAFVPGLNLIRPKRAADRPSALGGAGAGLPLDYVLGLEEHKRALYEDFHRMIPALADAFPERSIVIRPHPGESFDPWKALAGRRSNVQVASDGSVVPWLMAAQVLIHNGCTTAVEAAVLGRPAVTYRPRSSRRYDLDLPNDLSHGARDLDQLFRSVADILDGKLGPLEEGARRSVFESHLVGLDGRLAADRIVDVLEEAGYGRPPPPPRLDRALVGRAHLAARTAVKALNRRRRAHRNSAAFHRHRFPEIGARDLQERIERLGRQLGRFENQHVRRRWEHVFSIEC